VFNHGSTSWPESSLDGGLACLSLHHLCLHNCRWQQCLIVLDQGSEMCQFPTGPQASAVHLTSKPTRSSLTTLPPSQPPQTKIRTKLPTTQAHSDQSPCRNLPGTGSSGQSRGKTVPTSFMPSEKGCICN
jgi:hypothetical protein